MFKHATILGAVALSAVCTFAAPGLFPTVEPLLASGQPSQPPAQPKTPPMSMGAMHEHMLAQMKASDAQLNRLVADLDAASGDAKVTALTQVVKELVRQQQTMHAHMTTMMGREMGKGMEHGPKKP